MESNTNLAHGGIIYPTASQNAINNIWAVRGPWWRLPVEAVEEAPGVFMVRLTSIPLLKRQKELLHGILDESAFARVTDGWRIGLKFLKFIATKWTDDAEKAVSWNPPDLRASQFSRERSRNWIELRLGLVKDGWFKSEMEAELCLHIVCEAFMSRLVNERKPVDLGFVELYPSPRVKDFTERVDQFCRDRAIKIFHPIFHTSRGRWLEVLYYLCSHELTSVSNRNERVLWNVLAVPKKAWFSWTARREQRILKKLGEDEYKTYVDNCLKSTLMEAVKVMDDWRTKEKYAPPRRRKDRPVARPKQKEKVRRGRPRNPDHDLSRPPIVAQGQLTKDAIRDLEVKNQDVSEVPTVQPKNTDVRIPRWAKVDESDDW